MVFLFAMTFSARVSLHAGMAVAVVFGVLCLPPMYWAYSYWGGCVAAGGAAVLLAAESYRRGHAAAAGVTFAAGVMTLFLTRPYEGGVFALAAVAADGWLLYRERGKDAWRGGSRFLAASIPIVAAGLAWCAYYNYAVTGSALLMPHVLYDRQFMALPNFWFFGPRDTLIPDPRLDALRVRGVRNSGFIPALMRGDFSQHSIQR